MTNADTSGYGMQRLSADNDLSADPYAAPQDNTGAVPLTWKQHFVAVAIGCVVLVSSAATMTAFLFGVIVAFGGRSQPGQVSPVQAIADGPGWWLFVGGGCLIVAGSLFLGYLAWMKMLNIWRREQLRLYRRRELQNAVDRYREARQAASGDQQNT